MLHIFWNIVWTLNILLLCPITHFWNIFMFQTSRFWNISCFECHISKTHILLLCLVTNWENVSTVIVFYNFYLQRLDERIRIYLSKGVTVKYEEDPFVLVIITPVICNEFIKSQLLKKYFLSILVTICVSLDAMLVTLNSVCEVRDLPACNALWYPLLNYTMCLNFTFGVLN